MSSDYLKRVEVITAVVVIMLIVGMFNIVSRPNHNVYLFDENTGVLTVNGDFDMSYIQSHYSNMGVTKIVFTEECVFPRDCSELFANMNESFRSLEAIDLSAADFSYVKNMSYMFSRCYYVESIILAGIDTSKVTNMQGMFAYCRELNYVELINIDTSNVTDMSYMFRYCADLVDINLFALNMSSVTNMNYMFYDCVNLEYADVSTVSSSLQKVDQMFGQCKSLKHVHITPEIHSMINDTCLPNSAYAYVV